jgi:hypothetical protein
MLCQCFCLFSTFISFPYLVKSSAIPSWRVRTAAVSVKFWVGVPVQIQFQQENSFDDRLLCRLFRAERLWPSSITNTSNQYGDLFMCIVSLTNNHSFPVYLKEGRSVFRLVQGRITNTVPITSGANIQAVTLSRYSYDKSCWSMPQSQSP